MNLREEILREHSIEQARRIAEWACASPQHFKALITCFLDDDYRLSQRAAWSVSWAARKKPAMVQPHVKALVLVLRKKGMPDAVVRNALRVLQEMAIPKKFQGEVMDACFAFIEDPATPVAVKAFSLTVLFNLSKRYPEIGPELKLLIEERLPHETAAFRSRAKKILPVLEKQKRHP